MSKFYHDDSRELQDRFDTRRLADRIEQRLIGTRIGDEDKAFIESLDIDEPDDLWLAEQYLKRRGTGNA